MFIFIDALMCTAAVIFEMSPLWDKERNINDTHFIPEAFLHSAPLTSVMNTIHLV